jgi:hypothetical protein
LDGQSRYRVGMYFYELHEGGDEAFGDLLLAHDELFEPDEFFEMVQRIRRRIQGDFTQDTLIEAIGEGLENEFGFSPIDDDELTVSVFVSTVEDENAITPTGTFEPEPEWGSDDDEDDDEDDEVEDVEDEGDDPLAAVIDNLPDFVTITAEVKKTPGPLPH